MKEGGKHLHRETRTFGKLAQAKTWGAKRVAELEENGVPNSNDIGKMTVGNLLKRYINDPNPGGKADRTKRYVLDMLLDCDIADTLLTDLSTTAMLSSIAARETGWCPSIHS